MARPWMRKTIGVMIMGCSLVIGSAHSARSAEWSAEPSISMKGEYSDNLTITPAPHSEVYGHWTSPQVTFKGATERFEMSGGAAADFVNYYGKQPISITNMNFPLTARYKTERDTFGLDGIVTRDNTLMGELQQTGLVLNFTQRNLQTVNPTWTRAITERATLQTGYQYTNVTYDSGTRLGLVDYHTHTGNTGVSYRLTERDQIDVTGYFVQFTAPNAFLESEYYGAQTAFKHRFTERFQAGVSGGARHITSTAMPPSRGQLEDRELVWLYSADLLYQTEWGSLGAACSRTINPSGFGLLIRTQLCGVTVVYQATENLTLGLSSQAYWVDPITTQGTAPPFPTNRYFRVQPTLRWKLSEQWSVSASYSYAQRDIDALGQQAMANGTTIMLTYNLPKLSVSR